MDGDSIENAVKVYPCKGGLAKDSNGNFFQRCRLQDNFVYKKFHCTENDSDLGIFVFVSFAVVQWQCQTNDDWLHTLDIACSFVLETFYWNKTRVLRINQNNCKAKIELFDDEKSSVQNYDGKITLWGKKLRAKTYTMGKTNIKSFLEHYIIF